MTQQQASRADGPVTVTRDTAVEIVARAGVAGDALAADLHEVAESTDRLLTTVRRLSDDDLRTASRLPGWTRGHVLTHIARNADALVNLAEWARTGRERELYAGGREGRDAQIEAGAGRPVAEVLADLEASSGRLLTALADLPAEGLDRTVRAPSGRELLGRDIPLGRVREVEIHHVDLDAGYTPAHWPAAFVVRTLDEVTAFHRERGETAVAAVRGTRTGRTWELGGAGPVVAGQETGILAWLTGRSNGDGLDTDSEDPVPAAPRWI